MGFLRRALWGLGLFAAACTSTERAPRGATAAVARVPAPPGPKGPPSARADGSVLVAAAGDISAPALGRQKDTSDLVLAGGYDAVLLLGDLQYPAGQRDAFDRFFTPTWGRFKDRIWPAPGNHDYGVPDGADYFEYFGAAAGEKGKGYYSLELGDWHVVALNTNLECKAVPCDAGSAQARWLAADLAASKKKCTLAFWHHPRFSSGPHGAFLGAQALWDTLAAAGAEVLLTGHDHLYERFLPMDAAGKLDEARGLQEFVVGTGGEANYPSAAAQPNSAARETGAHGVLALSLKPGGWSWRFVPAAPSTFTDQGEGACH